MSRTSPTSASRWSIPGRWHDGRVSARAPIASSPFVELDREAWARLSRNSMPPLTEEDVAGLEGLGDRLDLREVQEVYLPVSRLLSLYVDGAQQLHAATSTF